MQSATMAESGTGIRPLGIADRKRQTTPLLPSLMNQTKRRRGAEEKIMKIAIRYIEGITQTAAKAEVANLLR
jgi:hypothetical protein